MSRLIEIGYKLAEFCKPYADSSELSYTAQARLGDLDGLTKVIVVPTNTLREIGRSCTHYTYSYEIGVARWLKEGEPVEKYVALSEQIADALTGEDLDSKVQVLAPETTICDTDLVHKRRQFLCVLTVEVMDGEVQQWQ